MADFGQAFEKTMRNEGGFQLHTVKGDPGGMTYAGISRRHHPDWEGWEIIDGGGQESPGLTARVRRFYLVEFWQRVRGEEIKNQKVAESLYDFAVNAGIPVAMICLFSAQLRQ
uniref:Glycosyl hydrolase 108 n=1 Tax=Candidatus Kentrum sp. DK TaxID=2126562 RepID=A0A450SYT3_9GAMM|nr:MAG: Glycosyl hydrolase 108 [Candidatus Kentron sp. DK]